MFSVEAKFSVALITLFKSLSIRFTSLRPVFLGRIDAAFRQMYRDHFESSGEGKWAPLSARTIRLKARKWPTRADLILRATDTMFHSLVGDTANTLKVVTPKSYRRGTIVAYAASHQRGIGVPLRQVAPDPLPSAFIEQVRAIVQDYLLTGRAA
jgi:hypothetical protein